MKRVVFKNSRNKSLVGHFYHSASQSVIIMSHGFTGDKSESGRFDVLAQGFHNAGFAVLAFDFSGSGESDDDSLSVEKQVDDLHSAIEFVQAQGYKRIGLFGHSLGGLVSLRCFSHTIKTMALTAPVTNTVPSYGKYRFSQEQLQELEEHGTITLTKDSTFRKKVVVDKKMLTEREQINQSELLCGVSCPVLIIHGTEDTRVPSAYSESAMTYLSPDSKLEIIAGANHSFHDHRPIVNELSRDWFLKHL